MGWFRKAESKGAERSTPPADAGSGSQAEPPPGVEVIGFKSSGDDVGVREASTKTCPSCNGNDLEIFEDGSFICMNCEHVSGGMAKEAVEEELQQVEVSEEAREQVPAEPEPPAAAPPSAGYQMGVSPPRISTTESLGRLDRIEETLGEVSAKVSKHEDMYNRIYSDLEDIKNKFARVEASTLELQGLYDSVSMLFNPFIDVNADTIREFIDIIKTMDPDVLRSLTKEDIPSVESGVEDLFPSAGSDEGAPPPGEQEVRGPTCPSCGVQLPAGLDHTHPPRPILEDLGGDITSSMISLQWLNFMVERVGADNVPTLLDFYRKLNWISSGVKSTMLWQMKGMKYETPAKDTDWKMEPNDHLKSLIYIHKIKGTELDRDSLERLEKDIQGM